MELLLAFMDRRAAAGGITEAETLEYERELDFWWDRLTLVEQHQIWAVARMTKMLEFEKEIGPTN